MPELNRSTIRLEYYVHHEATKETKQTRQPGLSFVRFVASGLQVVPMLLCFDLDRNPANKNSSKGRRLVPWIITLAAPVATRVSYATGQAYFRDRSAVNSNGVVGLAN